LSFFNPVAGILVFRRTADALPAGQTSFKALQ
jgi:hypothetical protein